MFNLMGRFSHIQMLRVGEVEFVDGGHLRVKNSYMVGNPEGLVFCVGIVKKYLAVRGGSPQDFLFCNFCVNKGKVVMLDTVISHDFFLKLFHTALDKVDLPGDDFSFHSVKSGAFNEAKNSGKVSLSVLEGHARRMAIHQS